MPKNYIRATAHARLGAEPFIKLAMYIDDTFRGDIQFSVPQIMAIKAMLDQRIREIEDYKAGKGAKPNGE